MGWDDQARVNGNPGREDFTTLDLIVSIAKCNCQDRNRLYELITPCVGSFGPLRLDLEIRGTARSV